MMLLFTVIIVVYGMYTIYAAVKMKKTQKLNGWFTGNSQTPIRDERGYIDYIYGRTIVMGATVLLFGAALGIHEYVRQIPQVINGMLLLLVTVCVWFYANMSRAKQKFW